MDGIGVATDDVRLHDHTAALVAELDHSDDVRHVRREADRVVAIDGAVREDRALGRFPLVEFEGPAVATEAAIGELKLSTRAASLDDETAGVGGIPERLGLRRVGRKWSLPRHGAHRSFDRIATAEPWTPI